MHRVVRLPALAAALAVLAALPAAAHADTVWLCRPGTTPDPCAGSLTTTRVSPAGTVLGTRTVRADRPRRVDCFYVYPTVSRQQTENADLTIDPEQRSVVRYQAARFAQHCRVYAPMYRQLTLKGIFGARSPAARLIAYGDVLAAWKEYLARYNKGRGVVLIGHSQGAFMLRVLLQNEIDPRPAMRRRLVSALLPGANVAVRAGGDRGGDFRHVPACRRPDQTGCVIAYSTFDAPVPAGALFGRLGGSGPTADATAPAGQEVLCTNPAALRGGTGRLTPVFPLGTAPPGTRAPAAASAAWREAPGSYSARCSRQDGAHVLRVRPLAGATAPAPSPTAAWGLHRLDITIALGNLVDLVGRQARAYTARHS